MFSQPVDEGSRLVALVACAAPLLSRRLLELRGDGDKLVFETAQAKPQHAVSSFAVCLLLCLLLKQSHPQAIDAWLQSASPWKETWVCLLFPISNRRGSRRMGLYGLEPKQ